MPWEFWIDRGGTFTDCIGVSPEGALYTSKVLSDESAPMTAIDAVLRSAGGLEAGQVLPGSLVALGTTVATNALLERRGTATILVANRGLGDILAIGTQERPDLFDLEIAKPPPLYEQVLEVDGRVSATGECLEALDLDRARTALERAGRGGARSVGIVMIHAYAHPEMESQLRDLALEVGFEFAVASHEVAMEIGLLARGETTCTDAYLTPLLRGHLAEFADNLGGARLRCMQSSGGLTDLSRFRGPNALLSGPAGGVVGAERVAESAGFERAIGFDMGGTSTDVSLIRVGDLERSFETVVGGLRVRAPMLRLHTIAAGGGSICRFDGISLGVGPESAGARPGPLCYGDRSASELTLSDVNFALGRVQPGRFPFPLVREPVQRALQRVQAELESVGQSLSIEQIAAGFVRIANANMAQAIEQVSLARGQDPRDCALVGFGGAAGQHVCEVARELGVRTVLLHPLAGVLSAYGIGISEPSWDGQRDAGREILTPDGDVPQGVLAHLRSLEAEGREALRLEAHGAPGLAVERRLDLRYVGTESPLSIREPADGDYPAAFAEEHRTRFGYLRPGRAVEVVTARVRLSLPGRSAVAAVSEPEGGSDLPGEGRLETVWFDGECIEGVPVKARESLRPGANLEGPAILLEDTGTVVIAPGFRAELRADGLLVLTDETGRPRRSAGDLGDVDPIRLEVLGNRFMAIAEQMGTVLRNTSVSTNIKERLDYSCAVFDGAGGLVANAPHIPVHLGAMSETVREVLERFPDLREGDVVVTNDPAAGGSHLPDVTAVTPVFESGDRPAFFVASRGHHADIGGITPGSMPSESQRLDEEGVVLPPFRLVVAGWLQEEELRERLTGAPYPARNPDDNVAELEAMLAANRCGVEALVGLAGEQGLDTLTVTMEQLQAAAASKVAREIARIPDGIHHFEDALDDGTPVCVAFEIRGERMIVDFEGTGAAVPGNLNAPRAVVYAALIYVLRSLVSERIPLNGGCLAPVEVRIPAGSLLDPPAGAAVVGGNVETSQRVVDVLLGAMGRAAASQGTMNNVAFGDASFGYYETIGGGVGSSDGYAGASGVHTHMTNTRITDPEILEVRHPVRLIEFALRRGSGGAGRYPGGEGLVRSYEFLAPVTVSLLTQRRTKAPFGLRGGGAGQPGHNSVRRRGGKSVSLPSCATLELGPGDRLRIETPGGGGFGSPDLSAPPARSRHRRPDR